MPPRRTKEERIWIVKTFAKNNDPYEVRRLWPYPTSKPSTNGVRAIAGRFDANGDVKDTKRSGRPKSVTTPANVAALRLSIDDNRRVSVRQLALETGVKRESVRRMLRNQLKLKAFRPTEVCGLRDDDYQKR